jgi:hypothetical protein
MPQKLERMPKKLEPIKAAMKRRCMSRLFAPLTLLSLLLAATPASGVKCVQQKCSVSLIAPDVFTVSEAGPSGHDFAIGMADGPNLYAYVRQNPWTHWDPHGLSIWTTGFKALMKGGDLAMTFVNVKENFETLSTSQSFGESFCAAFSIGSEFLPLSAHDVKAGYTAAKAGLHLAEDANKVVKDVEKVKDIAKDAERVADEASKMSKVAKEGKAETKIGSSAKDAADEGSKAAAKESGAAVETGEGGAKEYHGNDRRNTDPQHNYDILNKDGGVRKNGVGTGAAENGVSKRAESQLEEGDTYRITDRHEGGEGARGRAYDREKERTAEHRAAEEPMDRHKRPK